MATKNGTNGVKPAPLRKLRILSADQILSSHDLETIEVPVPEWAPDGAEDPGEYGVLVRTMTGLERDRLETAMLERQSASRRENYESIRALYALYSIVDEDGRQMFTEADIDALANRSAKALQRVFRVSQKLNTLEASEIEDLVGNSERTRSGGSSTG